MPGGFVCAAKERGIYVSCRVFGSVQAQSKGSADMATKMTSLRSNDRSIIKAYADQRLMEQNLASLQQQAGMMRQGKTASVFSNAKETSINNKKTGL